MKKDWVDEGCQQGGVDGQTALDMEVYGYRFDATDAIAAYLSEKMTAMPSCSEVNVSRDEYTPEYKVEFDREKLALNGLNVTTAAGYLRNRINGATASNYREEGDEYDILVRYAKEFRSSLEDIENIVIYNSAGRGVKIREVGKVIESESPPTIERKDRQRVVTVSCVATPGFAVSELVADVQSIMKDVDLPAGMSYQFGGTYESQGETFLEMFTLLIMIVILVFMVMAAQFESLTYPFVIMFAIPFALIGVLIGLWITNTPLNVMAFLGVLMLVGIVVNNGIVLIDYIILCRERGMNIIQAVVTSGKSRLRPILMTTLTTVLGMIPMAVGNGTGAEMWNSLGMAVAWGLSFSTVITLILVPTIYCVFAGTGVKRQRKKTLKEHEYESSNGNI